MANPSPHRPAVSNRPYPDLTFSPVPHDAYDDPKLKSFDRDLLGHLMRITRGKRWLRATNAGLGDRFRVSVRKIRYSLRRLQYACWIVIALDQDNPADRTLNLARREDTDEPLFMEEVWMPNEQVRYDANCAK